MLVPSMTLEEVRREIDKDFPILFRKAGYVGKKMERYHRPKRDEVLTGFFDYYSKYKNNWLCRIELTRKNILTYCMAYYYAEKGLAAIGLLNESDWLMYFSSHFFKRYNERLKLNIVMPNDLLKTYMNDQKDYVFKKLAQVSEDLWTTFCISDKGIILGMANTRLKFYKMNTFLSRDMLKGTQVEMEAQMNAQLIKYWLDAGKWEV
jgi:hypothetical protein